jgi:predicted acetyltransferase
MIELFPNKRGKGIGNETVEKLFDKTDWKDIHAEALSDAIPFWRKLGADFNMTDTKLKECCNKGYSADFTLHRKG